MRVTAVGGISGVEERGFDALPPSREEQKDELPNTPLDVTSASEVVVPLPLAFAVAPPIDEGNMRRRRRVLRARQRLTPFQEAAAQFAAIERQRLKFKQIKSKQLHEYHINIIAILKNIDEGIKRLIRNFEEK